MLKDNIRLFIGVMMLAGLLLALPGGAQAGGVRYEKDGKWVELGGRIQLQYHMANPENGEDTDEVFFRRLRPYIKGSIHEDWEGKFQFDLGKAEDDDEIAIKDAYLQYKGFPNIKVTVGNANFPFSRELLTSSKYQQLVERTFVGDHNFGTPDRQPGIHVTGTLADKKVEFGVSAVSASIDPSSSKLDFDTPVNRDSDFLDGWMIGGRVDFHPLGYVKMSQGDLKRSQDPKFTVGAAIFTWANDDDNNTGDPTKDVDTVTGYEVSGAFRWMGASVDAEYNFFDAETIDPTVTSGIYKNGKADLWNFALEGGFMVVAERLEVVAGYEIQDAEGYADEWTRISGGVNYFVKGHDVKLQATYRAGDNLNGESGNDEDELFVQAQYVF